MKFRTLFISHDASYYGATRQLVSIVKYLDKTKYEPVFIIGDEGPIVEEMRQYGKCYIQSLFPKGPPYLRELICISQRKRLLREIQPDLVYCNSIMNAKWCLYSSM